MSTPGQYIMMPTNVSFGYGAPASSPSIQYSQQFPQPTPQGMVPMFPQPMFPQPAFSQPANPLGNLITTMMNLQSTLASMEAANADSANRVVRDAQAGKVNAQHALGTFYFTGEHPYFKQDYKLAAEWWQSAANQGCLASMGNLGNLYLYGLGVKQDNQKAIDLYYSAAQKGHVTSQMILGKSYEFAEAGLSRDINKAYQWYSKAAQQGDVFSTGRLKILSLEMQRLEQQAAFERQEMERRKAELEPVDAKSQRELGVKYQNGDGVPKDLKLASEWYRKAADQNYLEAQNDMGFMYSNGFGVPYNPKTACDWYRKAAEQGHMIAQSNLAGMYEVGSGVPQSIKQAYEWFGKAASQGYEPAIKGMQRTLKEIQKQELEEKAAIQRQQELEIQAAREKQELERRKLEELEVLEKQRTELKRKTLELQRRERESQAALEREEQERQAREEQVALEKQQVEEQRKELKRKALELRRRERESQAALERERQTREEQERQALEKQRLKEEALARDKQRVQQEKQNLERQRAEMGALLQKSYQASLPRRSPPPPPPESDEDSSLSTPRASLNGPKIRVNSDSKTMREKQRTQSNASVQESADIPAWQQELIEKKKQREADRAKQEEVQAKEKLSNVEPVDAEEQFRLGYQYANGEGVPKNSKQAYKWYRKSAEQGHAIAQFNLGTMYDNGEDIPKNTGVACKWFRKAAEQGHAEAQFFLGLRYANGDGVPKDAKQACEWFEKSAKQGDAAAQGALGAMYDNGDGVPRDLQQACEWYRKAAKQGLTPVVDRLKAIEAELREETKAKADFQALLEKARNGDINAQYQLGSWYYTGEKVEKDKKMACEWFRKAAEKGHMEAQFSLGSAYANGEGVPKDKEIACKWFRKAATQGSVHAKDELTSMASFKDASAIEALRELSPASPQHAPVREKQRTESNVSVQENTGIPQWKQEILEKKKQRETDSKKQEETQSADKISKQDKPVIQNNKSAVQNDKPVVQKVTSLERKDKQESQGILNHLTVKRISWKDLIEGEFIGNGSYGDVYKGIWEGYPVAIKKLQSKTLTPEACRDFEREAEMMIKSQFDLILKLHGVCIEPGHFSMIMEYMPSSLKRRLRDGKDFPWSKRWKIALDMAQGLAHLHSRKIVHRDLKSENILLNSEERAKIADFGLAKLRVEISSSTSRSTNKIVGSTRWRAPELFKRPVVYTPQSDVYSLGMLLWELASRKAPYSETADEVTIGGWIEKGEKEKIPEDCPKSLAEIIRACWASPEKRPSAAQVAARIEAAIKAEQALKRTEVETVTKTENSALAVMVQKTVESHLQDVKAKSDNALEKADKALQMAKKAKGLAQESKDKADETHNVVQEMHSQHVEVWKTHYDQKVYKERVEALKRDKSTPSYAFFNAIGKELDRLLTNCKLILRDPKKTSKTDAAATVISAIADHAPPPFNIPGKAIAILIQKYGEYRERQKQEKITDLIDRDHGPMCDDLALTLTEYYENTLLQISSDKAKNLGLKAVGVMLAAMCDDKSTLSPLDSFDSIQKQLYESVIGSAFIQENIAKSISGNHSTPIIYSQTSKASSGSNVTGNNLNADVGRKRAHASANSS